MGLEGRSRQVTDTLSCIRGFAPGVWRRGFAPGVRAGFAPGVCVGVCVGVCGGVCGGGCAGVGAGVGAGLCAGVWRQGLCAMHGALAFGVGQPVLPDSARQPPPRDSAGRGRLGSDSPVGPQSAVGVATSAFGCASDSWERGGGPTNIPGRRGHSGR